MKARIHPRTVLRVFIILGCAILLPGALGCTLADRMTGMSMDPTLAVLQATIDAAVIQASVQANFVAQTPEAPAGTPTAEAPVGATAEPAATQPAFPSPTLLPSAMPATPTPPAPTQPAASPEPFIIQDPAFAPSDDVDCGTDIRITDVENKVLSVNGTISMRNGVFAIWCYGAKHTWTGTLTYAGYTFASDANDPLRFTIDNPRGYVYVGGKGTVTLPDGTTVSLPR